ncbi:MAG: guanylate kinase [Desulfuromonadales bacterium]|nr:guanylate kinase [Desulfuromonadales bacterium]
MKREGIVFIISAPSGAGKTSLCKEIIDIFPDLGHSISYTTRPRRSGEVDGKDYHFVSSETFRRMIDEGAFAEWAEVHDNRYGTALRTLEQFREQGVDILLDIDCQGAEQLRRTDPDGVHIFIVPPSLEELRRRLEGRRTDSAEVIERRIANARGEICRAGEYDYIVVNDDFPQAVEELKSIITAEGCRSSRLLKAVKEKFGV